MALFVGLLRLASKSFSLIGLSEHLINSTNNAADTYAELIVKARTDVQNLNPKEKDILDFYMSLEMMFPLFIMLLFVVVLISYVICVLIDERKKKNATSQVSSLDEVFNGENQSNELSEEQSKNGNIGETGMNSGYRPNGPVYRRHDQQNNHY